MYNYMIKAKDLNAAIDEACHSVIQLEQDTDSDIIKRECLAKMHAYGAVKIMIEELQKKGVITYGR